LSSLLSGIAAIIASAFTVIVSPAVAVIGIPIVHIAVSISSLVTTVQMSVEALRRH
jgi:hypothetical protein